MLKSQTIGMAFGSVLVLVGMLEFIPNPIVTSEAIFETNGMNNLVHLLTGSTVLFASVVLERMEELTLKAVPAALQTFKVHERHAVNMKEKVMSSLPKLADESSSHHPSCHARHPLGGQLTGLARPLLPALPSPGENSSVSILIRVTDDCSGRYHCLDQPGHRVPYRARKWLHLAFSAVGRRPVVENHR